MNEQEASDRAGGEGRGGRRKLTWVVQMMFFLYLHRKGSIQGCPSKLQGQISAIPNLSMPWASASAIVAGVGATAVGVRRVWPVVMSNGGQRGEGLAKEAAVDDSARG